MILICASERLINICFFRSQNTSSYIQSMQWYQCSGMTLNDSITDKTLTLRKSMNMRASGQFLHLLILKLQFPSIFFLVLLILCLRNTYSFRSPITSAYIYNQCGFLSLLMVWHYNINDSMPTTGAPEHFEF